jgi:hypothetical protein
MYIERTRAERISAERYSRKNRARNFIRNFVTMFEHEMAINPEGAAERVCRMVALDYDGGRTVPLAVARAQYRFDRAQHRAQRDGTR